MPRTLSKCATLAAAALLATLTGHAVAQATDLVWLCEIDSDGNAQATIESFGDQWFQINVAQDDCVNACDAQVRALGLESSEETQQIRDFQGLCLSDEVRSAIIDARNEIVALRIIQDPDLDPADEATTQVGEQIVACLDSSTDCFTAASDFDESPTSALRSACIDVCGTAEGACTAVVNRGDFTELEAAAVTAASRLEELRGLVNTCSTA